MAALKVFSACNKNSARQTKGLLSIASFEVRFAIEKMLRALKKICYKGTTSTLEKNRPECPQFLTLFFGGGVVNSFFICFADSKCYLFLEYICNFYQSFEYIMTRNHQKFGATVLYSSLTLSLQFHHLLIHNHKDKKIIVE